MYAIATPSSLTLSPLAQSCYDLIHACCAAIGESGTWHITIAESRTSLVIEVMAEAPTACYLVGRDRDYETAMRRLLKGLVREQRRLYFAVEVG